MAKLQKIRLSLARDAGHPDGDESNGYEFLAPLDRGGRIDADSWKQARNACVVRRIRFGRVAQDGVLSHRPGGHGGATWAFEYPGPTAAADDEEAGYRFSDHAFVAGGYVSVRDEDDGVLKTYRVVSVTPA